MKPSDRVLALPPYPFVEISRIIASKRAEGKNIITFGIGDPDLATPETILGRLTSSVHTKANHRYPETDGLLEFRNAVANWYFKRFSVELNPVNEVLSLIGAKEGIGHIALGLLNPGDIALQPDPAYPVYNVGTLFAGGTPYWMPLKEENQWLPDLGDIPTEIAAKAKLMWLNYPNNPTGAIASFDFLNDAVEFCKTNDIVLLHDACYSEVTFDGYQHPSLLQVPGAKDIAVEFHSLSKSFNMTGWRVGMAVGNGDILRSLFLVKSNLDSGVPQAIQEMAIEALSLSDEFFSERNSQYQKRRDLLVNALTSIGLTVPIPKASLYVWAKVPTGYKSAQFATLVLEELDIVVTPGTSYGVHGEGYIRLSLTLSDQDLEEGIRRLSTWSIPNLTN